MMNRIHTANPDRVYTDSRIGLFGEKEAVALGRSPSEAPERYRLPVTPVTTNTRKEMRP